MNALHSEGKCIFCGETFARAVISRHLNKHLAENTGKKKGKSFHLRADVAEMFLNLWIDGKTTMEELDYFLRAIWLECCGHMSSFIDKKILQSHKGSGMNIFSMLENDSDEYSAPGEIPKNKKAADVFYKDMKIQYDYDFGSTTRLELKILEEFPVAADKHIVLLSRNEPLEILCSKCGKKPAVAICSVCVGYHEGFFCEKCAKIHAKECSDFDDYAKMPVVNSPRMGICAYEGGTIDKNRDGVYKKN